MRQSMLHETQMMQERAELLKQVQLAEAVKRLKSNADFVTVFEMNYFTQQAVSHVRLLGMDTEQEQNIIQTLKHIGGVQRYLDTLLEQGAMAKDSILELDAIPLSEYEHD